MIRNIDLALLATFLDIVKTQNFAASAGNLNLTPAAVSARIKILEETLSAPLFTRNKHKVQITEYGRKLIPFAESMLSVWNKASIEFSIQSEIPRISVAAPESLLTSKLQTIANKLHSNFMDSHIHVQSQDSKQIFLELLEHKIDFGFMFDNFQHDSLLVEPLFDIKLRLYSTENSFSKTDIHNDNYVYVDWGKQFSKLHKKFIPQVTQPRFSASNWQMAINFLLEFGGSSLLPDTLNTHNLSPVNNSESISRTIYLGYHKQMNQKQDLISQLNFIKNTYSDR